MKNELIKLDSPQSLTTFAEELKKFIVKQNLFTNIQGKNYVNVEGWQFAGGNMGLFPVVESCERLDREGEIAYKASVALYSGEKIVSRGIALCSSKERSRTNADEYVISSMAQTRAEGKAYRMILGWLMKVAGYEATPKEEMDGLFDKKEKPVENTLEKAPFCDICGQEARKVKWGWSCPDWKMHQEKGEKPKMVQKKAPLDKNMQSFVDSLPE